MNDIQSMRRDYVRRRRSRHLQQWSFGALLAGSFLLALWPMGAEVCLLAAAVLMFLRTRFDRDFHLRRLPMDLPAGIFVFLSGLSVLVSPDRGFSFYNWYNLVVVYLLIYLAAGQLVRSAQDAGRLFAALGASAVACVLYGLWQAVFGISASDVSWVDAQAFPELTKRIFSTWVNPNIFAGYLDAALCIAFGFFVKVGGREKRTLLGVLMLALLVCLALTYARGALLVLTVIVAGYGLLRDWRVLAVFAVVAGGALAFDPVLLDRVGSVFTKLDTSSEMRLAFWESTIAMIQDHPFLGIGWGAYWMVYPTYDFYMQGEYIKIVHAHNLYLNYAAEIGLPGAVAFLWYFFGSMFVALRARFAEPEPLPAEASPFALQDEGGDAELKAVQDILNPREKVVPGWQWHRLWQWTDAQILGGASLGIGLAIVSVALNGFTDDLLFNIPTSMLLWLLMGTAGALALLPGYRGWQRRRLLQHVAAQPSRDLDRMAGREPTGAAPESEEKAKSVAVEKQMVPEAKNKVAENEKDDAKAEEQKEAQADGKDSQSAQDVQGDH